MDTTVSAMATRLLCNDFLEVRPEFVAGEALDNLFMRCSELVRVQTAAEIQPGVPCLLVEPEIVVFDKRCNQKRNVAFFRRAPVPGEQSVAHGGSVDRVVRSFSRCRYVLLVAWKMTSLPAESSMCN